MSLPKTIARHLPAWGLLYVLSACSPNQTAKPKTSPEPTPEVKAEKSETLTLYSGRSQVLIEPLLNEFTKSTGIQVEVRYDKSTQNLATRLLSEGTQTKADLILMLLLKPAFA